MATKKRLPESRRYVPERGDFITIDFVPSTGKEIGKPQRPALVLSGKIQNEAMGLLICCPVSTATRGHKYEVPVKREKRSVIVSSIIQTFDWQERRARFVRKATTKEYQDVMVRIIPIIGGIETIQALPKQ